MSADTNAERDDLMREPINIMRENAEIYEAKNADYGASWWSIGEVLWIMAGEKPITLESPADIVRFGLHTRRMDKFFREFNGEFVADSLNFESIEDSPSDESVYASMAAAVNRLEGEGRLPTQTRGQSIDDADHDPCGIEGCEKESIFTDEPSNTPRCFDHADVFPQSTTDEDDEQFDTSHVVECPDDVDAVEFSASTYEDECGDVDDRPRVYLAGAVDFADDHGASWRAYVKEHYADEIEAVNPLDKYIVPVEDLVIVEEDDPRLYYHPDPVEGEEGAEYWTPREIVDADRALIDDCDAMIVRWSDTPSCGTDREIEYVHQTYPDMPIMLVPAMRESLTIDDLPVWLRDGSVDIVDSYKQAVGTIREEYGLPRWTFIDEGDDE